MPRTEYAGDILTVRDVEDCIRATRKYTKGAFSKAARHPIQGEDFPSRVLTEHYEVYPDLDLDKKLPIWDAALTTADWLWGDVVHIDVQFRYDYTQNKAWVIILGGESVTKALCDGIPDFRLKLAKVVTGHSTVAPTRENTTHIHVQRARV